MENITKKQVTITEENDNEGETFNYILDVTEIQFQRLYEAFKNDDFFTIEKSNYDLDVVKQLNKQSKNSYMNEYGFYDLPENFDFDNFEIYEIFYKANKLIQKKLR